LEISHKQKTWLLISSFLTSFNSFTIYSIVCKNFASITGLEVITQIAITTVFVLGLGASAILFKPNRENALKLYLRVELVLVLVFFLLPLFLNIFLAVFHIPNAPTWSWIPFMLVIMLPLGLMTGIELPTFIKLLPKSENKILFINYSGSLVSSILITEYFKLGESFLIACLFIAALNFMIIFITQSLFKIRTKFTLMVQPIIFCILVFSLSPISKFIPTLKKMSYLQQFVTNLNDVQTLYTMAIRGQDIINIKSPYQSIDIVPARLFQQYRADNRWGLYLNHKIQFYSDTEKVYHQLMSFFPSVISGKLPKNILILGGGDLGLARELTKIKSIYPETNITIIELDPIMLKLAKEGPLVNHFNKYNEIKDQIKIVNDDAINFLRHHNGQYDFILADFPFPTSFELGKLYSKEFYKLVSKKLTKDGSFVLDFPFTPNSDKSYKVAVSILINTLNAAGFKNQRVFGKMETFLFNSKESFKPKMDYNLVDPFISNSVLSNFLDQTDLYEEYFSYSKKVHSIFKPALEFRIEKR
jgi:spermidine synthase